MVRDFFIKMPELCGCKNHERKAEIIAHVYDAELAGGTVWDRNNEDIAIPENRLEPIFTLLADAKADSGALAQCYRLCKIIVYNHYLDDHGEKYYATLVDKEYTEAKAAEKMYPAIYAVMPADEAVTGYWAG